MPTGKLKMYNEERGFGFITDEGGGPDVFVHVSALQRSGLDPENRSAN
jgi:CspA family cold shock protein